MSDSFYHPISDANKQKSSTKFSLPEFTLSGSAESGGFYTGTIDYEAMGCYKKSAGKANRQRIFELKNIDAQLGRGHMIYYCSIISVLIAMVVSFLISINAVYPLALEIYRIVLVGFMIYILLAAINALKNKKQSTQILVVYFLKWYIVLLLPYCILKFVLLHHTSAAMIIIDIVELLVVVGLLLASIRVRNELKKRDELIAEINFNNFFG